MSSLLNNEHAWGESLVSSFPDNVQSDSLDSWSVVGAALWNALPSLSLTGTLGKVAVQDFVRALISLSRFLWQTLLQPILCVVWVLLQVIYHFLSQEQVWQQVRKLAVGIWQWERSLTLQQHVGQVVVVCTLVCLYKVYRYLERTQVVQRKVRQIKMVRSSFSIVARESPWARCRVSFRRVERCAMVEKIKFFEGEIFSTMIFCVVCVPDDGLEIGYFRYFSTERFFSQNVDDS